VRPAGPRGGAEAGRQAGRHGEGLAEADNHLEDDNPEGPPVGLKAMPRLLHHLGRHGTVTTHHQAERTSPKGMAGEPTSGAMYSAVPTRELHLPRAAT
jgi:hypothetical protein